MTRSRGRPRALMRLGIQLDPHLAVEAAPDVHLGHARNAGKAVADLVFDQLA